MFLLQKRRPEKAQQGPGSASEFSTLLKGHYDFYDNIGSFTFGILLPWTRSRFHSNKRWTTPGGAGMSIYRCRRHAGAPRHLAVLKSLITNMKPLFLFSPQTGSDTFSRPVVWNTAEGFAICSLSFSKLLPKAKYMKLPLTAQDII